MGCCAISSSSCEGENIIREILSKTKINNIGINDIDNQFVAKFSGIDDTSMPKSSIYTKALYSIVFVNDDSDAEIDENERKLTSSLFFFENANAPIEGNIRNSIFSYCLSIASEESESKFLSLFNFLEKTNQNNHDAICSPIQQISVKAKFTYIIYCIFLFNRKRLKYIIIIFPYFVYIVILLLYFFE